MNLDNAVISDEFGGGGVGGGEAGLKFFDKTGQLSISNNNLAIFPISDHLQENMLLEEKHILWSTTREMSQTLTLCLAFYLCYRKIPLLSGDR